MELIILEVDGSLSNPLAATAVLLWALILCLFAALVASAKSSPLVRVSGLIVAALAVAGTRIAQQSIGSLLYSLYSWRLIDVGFWYGPPVWIAPTIAGAVGVGLWARQRTRRAAP